MSDISVKVDILPIIEPGTIQKAVEAASTGLKLNIEDADLAKGIVQNALNTAAAGLKLNIGDVQFDGKANLGKDINDVLLTQYGKASKKTKLTPPGFNMKQLANSLTPLEARLDRLRKTGFDGWKIDKLGSRIKTAQNGIKSLSGATSGEFRRMAGAVQSEIKAIESALTRSERVMQQRLMGVMKPVNSMYGSLYNKMGKSGLTAKRSQLESSYHTARMATEKEVSARMSGNVGAANTLGVAAKKAREDFLALGRSIEEDFSSISKLKSTLASLESQNSIFKQVGADAELGKVNELEAKIRELKIYLDQLGSASDADFDKLRAGAEGAAQSAKEMVNGIKAEAKDMTSDLRSVYSLLEKIDKIEKSGKIAAGSELGINLSDIKKSAEAMTNAGFASKRGKAELLNNFKKFEFNAGREGIDLSGTGGSTSRIASLFKNVTGAMIFYEAFQKAKQAARAMYESVVSVDDAMTQLKIVTGASGSEMSTFFKEASASATELGHSVSDVLGSIETFSRLGYNLKDALNLSNAATVMSNVAAVGVDESTSGLTSIIKGYGLEADQSMEVADKLTLVGQNWAVSAGELMEALSRGGSSLAAANNSLDESVALIAAGNASVQDAASVGTTLKTVSARIRGSEAVYDKDAADYEGLAESVSKYRKEIMALSGVDIMSDTDSYKSTYQIFLEIAQVWDQMSDISQAALAERLGGKRNMNVVMSIIQNLKDLEGAYNDSVNAAGTAKEANDIYMDSISGKIGQFKAQWDVFSSTAMDSDMVKPFIGGATKLLSVLTMLIGALKHLGPVIPIAGIYGAGKGIGALARDLQDLDGDIGAVFKKLVSFSDKTKESIGTWIKNNPAKIAKGVAIGAAVAVAAQIAYLNSYEKKYADFKKSLEESQTLAADASAMDETIKSNNSRIQVLENMKNTTGGLSAVDEAELSVLKNQTAELERQRDIRVNLAKVAKETTAEKAMQAVQTKTGMFDLISEAIHGNYKEYRTSLFEGLTPTENVENNAGFLREQVKKKKELEEKLAKMDPERAKNEPYGYGKEYKKYEKELDRTNKKITETRSNLSENIASLSELLSSLNRDTPEENQLAEHIENVISEASRFNNETLGKTIYDTIGEAVANGGLEDAGKKLQVLAATGSLTEEQVERFRKSNSELDSYMRTSGASAKEISEYFLDTAKSSDKLGDNALSNGLVLNAYSSEIESLETSLGELSQLQSKLDSGELEMTDLTRLSEQFPELANNVDFANGKFTGLARNIATAKQETIDGFVETLEDLEKNAGSKAQKAVFEDLIKYVKGLGDAARETSNLYGGLSSVIQDANLKAKGTAATVGQEESNAAYAIDVSAIKKMKEYRDAGMTGLGNIKYWNIADQLFDGGYDNVTPENVEKKRKKLDEQYKKWYKAFDDVDSDGKLTHAGAEKFLEIISEDEKVVDRMDALHDSIKQNEDGGWDIDVDYSHLKILAKEAGLTENALRDLFIQVSMFGDLNWNKNGPANALSLLSPDSWEYKSGKVDLSYEEAKSAASKLGVSVTDYAKSVGKLLNREVKLVDNEGKQVDNKQKERDKKIAENSNRHQGRTHANEQVNNKEKTSKSSSKEIKHDPSKNTDRHQGRAHQDEQVKMTPKVDTSKLDAGMKDAKKKAESTMPKLKMDVDTSKADKKIEETKKNATKKPAKVKIEYVKHKGAEKNTDRHQGPKFKEVTSSKGGASGKEIGAKKSQPKTSRGQASPVKIGADTSQADSKVNSLIQKVTGKTYTMKVKADTSGQTQSKPSFSAGAATKTASGLSSKISGALKDQVVNIAAKVTGTKDVHDLKKAEDTVKDKKVTVAANSKGKSGVDALRGSINSTNGRKVSVNANTSGKGSVDSLRGSINSLHDKNVTITTTVRRVTMNIAKNVVSKAVGAVGKIAGGLAHHINGTAHILGTAFKSGTWGSKNSGKAIGGEVGPELVIRGNRFFTIGDDGAEFFNYRKGDVIFNAAQTEQIFKKGKLTGSDTRAHAYKAGNAFISGSVSFGGNGSSGYSGSSSSKKKKKTSNNSSKKSSSSRKGGSSSKRKSTKNSNKSRKSKKKSKKSNKKKKSSNKAEAEYLDWIEVALDRIERKIKKFDTTANSTFKKMSTRNKSLKKEMSAVSREITLQSKGYTRYIKQANKVKFSKKEKKYRDLVQNGAIDIDSIKNEKLQKKISQYQEWINKAYDCRDAIQELKEKESELIKQRFDNIVKSYEQTLTRINTFSDTIQSFIDLAETRGFQNNTRYYRAMMGFDKKEITKLKAERKKLTNELNRDVKSGKIKLHSEAWYEMRAQIDDTTKAIVDATKDWEESANKIRQIEWDRADYNHQSMTNFADEATFLAGLVDDSEIYNDNGDFTKRGLMVQGLHTQNYNTYMRDADAYAKDLRTIDKKIAKDPYDKELLDRRQELLEAQRKSIEAAQQEKKSLQDLAKNGVQKVVTSLKDLIDKYLKALDSQKD